MNAQQRIRQAAKSIYNEGDANALTIYKGFAPDTHHVGWHVREFGRQEHTFLGVNVAEALETIAQIAQEQADEHAEVVRGMRGPGRPKLDDSDPTERITITVPASIAAKAAELGNGNVSAGVRLAVEQA